MAKIPKPKFSESDSFMAEGLERLKKIRDEARQARVQVQDLAEQIDHVVMDLEEAFNLAKHWEAFEAIDPSHVRVFFRVVRDVLIADALLDLGLPYIEKLERITKQAREQIEIRK